MTDIIKTHGIKDVLMKDLKELNGFHEITDREVSMVTEPEWKKILVKHYPGMEVDNKKVHVDLDKETIVLE